MPRQPWAGANRRPRHSRMLRVARSRCSRLESRVPRRPRTKARRQAHHSQIHRCPIRRPQRLRPVVASSRRVGCRGLRAAHRRHPPPRRNPCLHCALPSLSAASFVASWCRSCSSVRPWRAKQIEGRRRARKRALVERDNPAWRDLSDGWYRLAGSACFLVQPVDLRRGGNHPILPSSRPAPGSRPLAGIVPLLHARAPLAGFPVSGRPPAQGPGLNVEE